MDLKVKVRDSGYEYVNDLSVGDFVLCSDSEYHEVRSVISYSCESYTMTLSNFKTYNLSSITEIKTTAGFKLPEQGDRIFLTKKLQPFVHTMQKNLLVELFHDIMIDVPMISKEGIVFKTGV